MRMQFVCLTRGRCDPITCARVGARPPCGARRMLILADPLCTPPPSKFDGIRLISHTNVGRTGCFDRFH